MCPRDYIICVVGGIVLPISVRSNLFIVLFKSSLSLFIFCLVVLLLKWDIKVSKY